MEAYDMSKSEPGFNEKLGSGPCSSHLPSLACVLAAITALVLIVTPCIYSLSVLQAQGSLVGELRTEIHSLRQRVDQLEALHTSQISSNKEQDAKMRQFLLGSTYPESETENVKRNRDLLEKLFRDLDLGSGSELGEADVQNTEPFELVPQMDERGSVRATDEIDHTRDNSDETPIRHHSDKLLTNRKRDRDDVSWETTNRKSAIGRPRPRRQAENRESRNRNRDRNRDQNRDRNRDRKASKGSSKRNRGNRGSTGTREQEQPNDGGEDTPPPQPQTAYIHFVGNVSSRVNTDPERTHPLSPRVVNISATLLSDWAYARWTTHRQKSKFAFNSGVVTVKEPGTYFVYSQVQFFDDERYTGHVITINEQQTFKCAEGRPTQQNITSPRNMKTCYVGGLAYLHRDSRVAVRVAFPNRWVNMHHDSTYFGMYKVS